MTYLLTTGEREGGETIYIQIKKAEPSLLCKKIGCVLYNFWKQILPKVHYFTGWQTRMLCLALSCSLTRALVSNKY